ncbi:flagella assembly protein FlgT middle domain-containing protein [Undibacterium sp. SXout20W]|uniref:flagella assembly protein FlgT middle domain-containing protein n=1 Tax=Undibacterium sp. SXout20W TaxID=3413051 RepID=UPI003BF15DE1
MRSRNWPWLRFYLAFLVCFYPVLCGAQALNPGHDPGRSVLMTGFAVNHPAQLTDIDDIALGFPRELARRLEQGQQFTVRTTPELLSYDWKLSPATPKMLAQVAATYDARYVISGDVRNAGIHTVPTVFGLWEKKVRAIDIEICVYDAKMGSLIERFKFSGSVTGDVIVGKDRSFDSEGFRATPFGKTIDDLLEQSADAIRARLIARP